MHYLLTYFTYLPKILCRCFGAPATLPCRPGSSLITLTSGWANHVRELYPLLDAEMMQCCEELLVFLSRHPHVPRPVPRQRATREAGGRSVLPDPSFSILKAHLLTRRYAGCFRAPCRA